MDKMERKEMKTNEPGERRTAGNGADRCTGGPKQNRSFFLRSDRIGFSVWNEGDLPLARLLWGNPQVTRYICASGTFSETDIENRLKLEISNETKYGVQYWPVFQLEMGDFLGCCGLRPHGEGMREYEIGIHLRPEAWGQGYASEAARAVIACAFAGTEGRKSAENDFPAIHAECLFAGHHPDNHASEKLLAGLGFHPIGTEFYAPTGLYHPSYRMEKPGNCK